MKLSNLIKKINKENAPEAGKLYALTGAPGSRCIANGHSWKDSAVEQRELQVKTSLVKRK
jgi:hypothetical protein